MSKKSLSEMNQTLADLMRRQLGVRRGKTLQDKLRRAGRLLPRRLRQEAQVLAENEARAAHPKLRKQVDQNRMERAFAAVEAHLLSIDPADRLKGRILGILAMLAFNFLAIFAGVITWMVWTGRL